MTGQGTTDLRHAPTGTSYSITPRVRSTARRLAFWVGALVFVLLVGLVTLVIAGTGAPGDTLAGTNATANGSKALIQVLRDNGVTVSTPRTLSAAALDAGGSTENTLVLYDEKSLLDETQLRQLADMSDNLILIQPSFTALSQLAPEIGQAGAAHESLTGDCSFLPVTRAGAVEATGNVGYRFVASAPQPQSCLGSGDKVYSLLRYTQFGQSVTVFGAPNALTNQSIVARGNAALALGLFGQSRHLIWYLPSTGDLGEASGASVPDPGWLFPTTVLACLVLLAAAVWRGRRLGPLVIENLPVVVRSSETMEGRARLYQKASSRTHALDSLRIGTIGRLAALCGLPRSASVTEVVGAVSTVTGRPAPELRELLVDAEPRGDAQFMRMSDDLLALEADVLLRTRPN
jgi:hypothetical protein